MKNKQILKFLTYINFVLFVVYVSHITEALELNNQIQQTQQQAEDGSGMFQLPPGTLNMDIKMQVDSPQNMDTKENMIQSQVMCHTSNMGSPSMSMGDLNQQVLSPAETLMNTPVSIENSIFQQGVVTKQETIDSILQQGSPVVHQQPSSPMLQGSNPMMQQQETLSISDHVNVSTGNHQQSFGLNIESLVSQGNHHHIDMEKILSGGLHGNANVGVGSVTSTASEMISSHLSGTMVTSTQPLTQLSRQNSSNSLTSNSSNSYNVHGYSSQNNILDVSQDFANILQDAKKDHPENIDKMAEAILNVSLLKCFVLIDNV